MSSVELSGGLSSLALEEVDANTELLLQDIGELTIEIMRYYTEPHDFTEALTKSIMWRTQQAQGGNDDGDNEIDAPEEANAVNIGSANDHAFFREHGTGAHITNDRQDEFLENMIKWCQQKLGFDPADNPTRYWNIVNYIRRNGTEAAPFALSSVQEIASMGKNVATYHIQQFWREVALRR